jgi:hypothetical protein
MRSEAWAWAIPVLAVIGVILGAWVFAWVAGELTQANRWTDDDSDTERDKARRRGVSGAAFALQQVFDPGIEHVLRAERDAQAEEADPSGGGDLPETPIEEFRTDLDASLAQQPIDPEEVRRLLASARRAGHDWRALYDESVRAVLAERPYLAPAIPPAARVAPRQGRNEPET